MRYLFIPTTMFLVLVMLGCNRSESNPDFIAGINDANPFGEEEDLDDDALLAFANENGVDLPKQLERAYVKDLEALAPVFKLSLEFTTLDKNARTYAQVIWSSLLNLGERQGVNKYAEILAAQDPAVQQRIRDILYYPVVHIPKSMSERRIVEQETRKDYPTLFPSDYGFGDNDPVFR